MKAYVLDIVFRGPSQKISRRVLVPEELTFSQLAFVLNISLGWEKETDFSFLLPSKKIIVTELQPGKLPNERLQEASDAQLYTYLADDRSFCYLYANRHEMIFDITLDEVIDPWGGRKPHVLDWAGACTAATALAKAPPAENASEYDEEDVNCNLDQWCTIDRRRYEHRKLAEIYADIEAGKYGFSGYKARRPSVAKAFSSPDARKAFFSIMFHDSILKARDDERMPPTLQMMLSGFAKDELVSIAEQKGVDVRPGMRKQEIIRRLTKTMLDPRVMENYFLCLGDEELRSLRQLLAAPDTFEEDSPHTFENLSEAGYIAETPDSDLVIARDVAKGFIPFIVEDSDEFDMKRRQRTWLIDTLLAANILYSVTPVDILCSIYKQGGLGTLEPAELKQEVAKLPPEFLTGYWLRGDLFVSEDLEEEEINIILDSQGDAPFYIPGTAEIPLFAQGLGLSAREDEEALIRFFHQTLYYDEEETAEIMQHLHWSFLAGAPVSFVRDMLNEDGYFDALTKEQDVTLRRLLNRLHDNTRSVSNRGFTPNEIKEQRQEERAKKAARKKAAREKVVFLKDRNKNKEKSH